MFHGDIQTPRRVDNTARSRVFYEIRGVSIAHENLFRVFDICSKSKQGLNRKLGNKTVKFYVKILYSLVMIC